jgi:hypothetical protein
MKHLSFFHLFLFGLKSNKNLAILILALGTANLYSQERVLASGGDLSGSNGSSNYSVGQIVQNVVSSSSGSVFQGIQFFFPSATLSVIDLETNMEVIAYPNPTSSVFNIQLHDNATHEMKYELYNLLGQSILSGNIFSSTAVINLSHLPNAVYLLRISDQNNENFKTLKIIKN